MARKPNYRADRIERDRVKAAKKAKRSEARAERSARAKGDFSQGADAPDDAKSSEGADTEKAGD